MNLNTLNQKKDLVSSILLVVALLAVLLMLARVAGFFLASARAGSTVEDAIKHSQPDAKNLTNQLSKSKEVADALKKKNLFSPPEPRRNPITAVAGIIGDEAIINGKLYKVGAKVGDAKILAINATSVVTEWDGKKITFNPIDGGASAGPGGSSRPGRPGPRRSSGSSRPEQADMVVTQGPGAAGRGPGGGPPGGGGMTPGRFRNMSDAERSQMRERFRNMSDAEREAFRARMRERFGGRGGGRGGSSRGGRGGR